MRIFVKRQQCSHQIGALGMRAASVFAGIPMGPPDPIFGIGVAFKEDPSPKKVNLTIGVYRGDDGLPFVLPSVREAEKIVLGKNLDMEYAPMTGLPGFVKCAQELVYGSGNPILQAKRVASTQSLSGTGALRLGAQFLSRFFPGSRVYLPTPTWPNHVNIMRDAGLVVERYAYYNQQNNAIDADAMLKDLNAAQEGSIVLLHSCAHNPTGMDPSAEQWARIREVVQRRKLIPFLDNAYQGFASGSLEKDAAALIAFSKECETMLWCQSFAKNFGLYGHRIGALHVQCASAEESSRVESQLKLVVRAMYSNPPIHGARLVETVLTTPALRRQWEEDLKMMADRMGGMRVRLLSELSAVGSTRSWDYIGQQIGMMAFTGLNKDQVTALKTDFHVYLTDDGRMAIPGLTTRNVRYVAESFHAVTK